METQEQKEAREALFAALQRVFDLYIGMVGPEVLNPAMALLDSGQAALRYAIQMVPVRHLEAFITPRDPRSKIKPVQLFKFREEPGAEDISERN